MDNFILQDWLILLITAVLAFAIVYGLRWLILARHTDISTEKILPRQLILIGITIVALIAVILALPVSESSRNQVLGLLGVLVSGIIAFSSTTIVANLMAGLILRVNKPFKTGDYIRCANFSGRVTDKGILDTEIQTEQRTLVHIANSFVLANPVEVVRSSGTFISAEVSIGYDAHHSMVEKHLLQATQNAGLTDAFVHVTALGNFSVNYKVSGMLVDTKSLLTSRSKLHVCILDELHNHNIEIMSPNFIASRTTNPDHQYIAKAKTKEVKAEVTHEDLAFDKAEEAEQIEQKKLAYEADIAALKAKLSESDSEHKDALKAQIEKKQSKLSKLSETPKVQD